MKGAKPLPRSWKSRYQNWQRWSFFRGGGNSRVFSSVMGVLASPIYEWALNEMESDLRSATRILDVGCGNSILAAHAARRKLVSGALWLGVDQSLSQLSAGRARVERMAGPRSILTVAGLAEALPIREQSLDLVVSTGSINLWQPPVDGLKECLRVLRPGGTLWLFDQAPIASSGELLAALFRQRIFGLGLPGYSVKEVEDFAKAAGWPQPNRRVVDRSLYGLRWTLD